MADEILSDEIRSSLNYWVSDTGYRNINWWLFSQQYNLEHGSSFNTGVDYRVGLSILYHKNLSDIFL